MSITSAVFGTKKRIIFACTAIFCSTILFSTLSTPAHAQEMGASIEVPPSLTLSVPVSVSMNVTPGVKDFDSKSCNIVVGTNSIAGYTLTTSATSTNLTNTTDSTKTISTLPSSSEGYTESNFVANKWGYKIGNGNYKPYVSEVTLADTHEQTAGDTTALTFATKVDFDQPTGTYNLTVNFSAVAKVYVPPYMQDLTVAEVNAMDEGDTKTLIDSRDNQSYTVAKLPDGNVWMTKNLRFTGTSLDSSTTNINTTKTLSYGDLTSGNSNTEPRIHDSGDATTGVWYNYCAASAGTICTDSDSTEASYSLCPAGWRLPTYSEQSAITSYSSDYSPVAGGDYRSGSLGYTSYGSWWSSTAYYDTHRYGLSWNGSSLNTGGFSRHFGYYVRCVLDIPTMQDFTVAEANAMDEGETTTLRDSRDGQDYTVTKLPDGNVWMTQNLRFTGTSLDPSTSDVKTAKTITYGDLTSGESYDQARIHNSGNATNGVWYNYAAASAMSITGGSSNNTEATESICPKGWRLPTSAEQQAITSYISAFSPVTGGYYYGGSLASTGGGFWWSSTADGGINRYRLYYNGSRVGTSSITRDIGIYVRCVLNVPTMQDFTVAEANAMDEGETTTLRDSRDGQDYTVAKLADGNVWMVDNLNLGATTLSSDLTSSNTNLSTTISASNFNSYKKTSGTGTYTAAEYIPVSGTDATSQTPYGTLYNYCAATAGTYCMDLNSTSPTYDICPKGWRLPTREDYENLYSNPNYNTNAKMRAPISEGGAAFALAGIFKDGAPYNLGSYGAYWSSQPVSRNQVDTLALNTSGTLSPYVGWGRNSGLPIRCVLETRTLADLNNVYMQDIPSGIVANTAEGATATLKDYRDYKSYAVAKINGLLWMTKNLDLAGGTTLTSTDSNVTSDYTLPASSTSGFSDYSAYVYNSGSTTCGDGSPCYSYYSYAAATAGTNPSTDGESATSDICPKGWRLPTQAEFNTLVSSYSTSSALTGSPFLAVYGGYYYNSSFKYGGSRGHYWSSTARSSSLVYGLNFDSSSGANAGSNGKSRGFSVRCVKS